jgi:hypothetical protein
MSLKGSSTKRLRIIMGFKICIWTTLSNIMTLSGVRRVGGGLWLMNLTRISIRMLSDIQANLSTNSHTPLSKGLVRSIYFVEEKYLLNCSFLCGFTNCEKLLAEVVSILLPLPSLRDYWLVIVFWLAFLKESGVRLYQYLLSIIIPIATSSEQLQ